MGWDFVWLMSFVIFGMCDFLYFPSFSDIPCAVVFVLLLQVPADPLEDLGFREGDPVAEDGFQLLTRQADGTTVLAFVGEGEVRLRGALDEGDDGIGKVAHGEKIDMVSAEFCG